jgi:hypothetical protein
MVDLLVKVPCSDMHKSFTPNAISGTPLTLFRCDRRHATMHVNIFIHVHVKPERAMVSIFFFFGPKTRRSFRASLSDSCPLDRQGVGFEVVVV